MSSVRARKLRLRAESPAALRRATDTVQNALRTAALSEDGRLYVVRRLSLGVFAPSERPERLSEVMAQRFTALRSSARHASDPGAAGLDAVWFRDASEALSLMLERLLCGQRCGEWFWPLVLRERCSPLGPTAERVLLGLAAHGAGGVAVHGALVRALGREPGGVLAVLAQIELDALSQAIGLSRESLLEAVELSSLRLAAKARTTRPAAAVRARFEPALARAWPAAASAWRGDGPRLLWLAAVSWLGTSPSLAASPARLLQRARELVSACAESFVDLRQQQPRLGEGREKLAGLAAQARSSAPASSTSAQARGPDGSSEPLLSRALVGAPPRPVPAPPALHPSSAAVPRDEPGAPRQDAPAPTAAARWSPVASEEARAPMARGALTPLLAQPTNVGGLLFLLRVLEALGLAELLQRCPAALELGLPARVLVQIAEYLGVVPDDALLEALRALFGPAPERGLRWRPPSALRPHLEPALSRRASRGPLRVLPAEHPAHAASVARLVGAFVRGCELFCRSELELELRDIVLRAGALSVSSTHLDVSFALQRADARIRVAGLDLDPGWLPWLGRVVLFHYREQGFGGGRS